VTSVRLIAISDRKIAGAEATLERFAELGRIARPASVVFQLRDLGLSARERLAFGGAMLRVARGTGQPFVVNDCVDIAVLLGADGVHLGETGMETADARRLLGETSFVSRACHDPSRVASIDADVVLLSPICEARKGRAPLGTDGLRAARTGLPSHGKRPLLFALGAITAQTALECIAAGADGVAVVGSVLRGEGPELVRALGIGRVG
jgi:thiamine-phosphate pyrophosphorylase